MFFKLMLELGLSVSRMDNLHAVHGKNCNKNNHHRHCHYRNDDYYNNIHDCNWYTPKGSLPYFNLKHDKNYK